MTSSVSSVDKKTVCSVCLEDVDPRENESTTLQCQHTFHQKCIRTWHAFQVNCPLCRKASSEKTSIGKQSRKTGSEQSGIDQQIEIMKQRIQAFTTMIDAQKGTTRVPLIADIDLEYPYC